MKLTVFTRVYGIPILLIVLLLIRFNDGLTAFSTFGKTAFAFSVTMIALLTDKRYIQQFHITDNRMVITYITQFLQTKTDEIDLSAVSYMDLSNRRSIALVWPPYLYLKFNGDAKEYIILSKDLYNEVQTYLASYNSRFAGSFRN